MGKALNIVQVTQDGTIKLNERMLKRVFGSIPTTGHDVAIVSILGAFSLEEKCLVNTILHYLQTMHDATDERDEAWAKEFLAPSRARNRAFSETNALGIWIYSEPFICSGRGTGKPIAVLLMDVECGDLAQEQNQRVATCLFGISALLSSLQIVAFSKQVQLEQLRFVATFCEFAHMVVCGSNTSPPSQMFQRFECWVSESFTSEQQQAPQNLQELEIANAKFGSQLFANNNNPLQQMFHSAGCVLLPPTGTFEFARLLALQLDSMFAAQDLAPKRIVVTGANATSEELFNYFAHVCSAFQQSGVPLAVNTTPPSTPQEETKAEEEAKTESWAMWGLNFIPIVGTVKHVFEAKTLYDDDKMDEAKLKAVEVGISLVGDMLTLTTLGMGMSRVFAQQAAKSSTTQVAKVAATEVTKHASRDVIGRGAVEAVKKGSSAIAAEEAAMLARESAKQAIELAKQTAVCAETANSKMAAKQAAQRAAQEAIAKRLAAKQTVGRLAAEATVETMVKVAAVDVVEKAGIKLTKRTVVHNLLLENPELIKFVTATALKMCSEFMHHRSNNQPSSQLKEFASELAEAERNGDCQRVIQLTLRARDAEFTAMGLDVIKGFAFHTNVNKQACCTVIVRSIKCFGTEHVQVAESGCDAVQLFAMENRDLLIALGAKTAVLASMDNPNRVSALQSLL